MGSMKRRDTAPECAATEPGSMGSASHSGAARLRREAGFALLVVLWSLSLLALIGTHVTAAGRGEAQRAANLRMAAAAEAAADGVLYQAVFHLLDSSPQRWLPDGMVHELQLPNGVAAEVRVGSDAGKINPNTAPAGLLRALLLRLGAEPQGAAALAAAILDWRTAGQRPRPLGAKEAQYRAAGRDYGPPGSAFESTDELGLVLGMTPELLARLAPLLSIWQEGLPDPFLANPVVMQALADALGPVGTPDGSLETEEAPVVVVTATATLPGGARFTRQAHLRLGTGKHGRPWQILTWGMGGD